MVFQLVFLFIVSIVRGVQQNLDLSGALTPLSVGSVDQYTIRITGAASANPLPSEPTLSMTGGQCTISGNGNTVTLDRVCDDNNPCPGSNARFISISGGQFTLSSLTFSVASKWLVVIRTSSGIQTTLTSCTFTGVAQQYAMFENTNQVTLTKCTFENIKDQDIGTFFNGGFALTVKGCNQFTLTDGVFSNITAGAISQDRTTATGFAAPLFISSSTQATISGTSFKNCTGLLAGAILALDTGLQNTYTNLVFGNNVVLAQAADITALLADSNFASNFPELKQYLTTSAVLGNDVTAVGGSSITVTGGCSSSQTPHFRNGTAGSTVTFDSVCKGEDDASSVLRAPAALTLLLTAVAFFLLLN